MMSSLKLLFTLHLVVCSILSLKSQDYDYDDLYTKKKNAPNVKKQKATISGEGKSYLLFNINAAIPLGDYGSTDLFDENPAFAKTGFDLSLNAGFRVYEFIYSYSSFGYIKNKPHLDELTELYSAAFSQGGLDLLDLEYKGYNHLYLLTGFEACGKIDIISLSLRLQLGLSVGIDAEQNLVLTDGTYTFDAVSEKATAFSIMPGVGTSIKIKLKENLLFSVNCDYKHAKYHFTEVKNTIGGNSTLVDYEMKTDVISVGAGMGVEF